MDQLIELTCPLNNLIKKNYKKNFFFNPENKELDNFSNLFISWSKFFFKYTINSLVTERIIQIADIKIMNSFYTELLGFSFNYFYNFAINEGRAFDVLHQLQDAVDATYANTFKFVTCLTGEESQVTKFLDAVS